MIFDPALAAAARRHVRAQAKSQKASSAAGPANSSETGTSSSSNTNVKVSQEATLGTTAAASSAADSASTSADLGGTAGKVIERGEHAGPATGGVGGGIGGGGEPALSLARASSAFSNGADLEGVTRVGPVAPRPRAMKRRVLLKIVVLGCSNVSRVARSSPWCARRERTGGLRQCMRGASGSSGRELSNALSVLYSASCNIRGTPAEVTIQKCVPSVEECRCPAYRYCCCCSVRVPYDRVAAAAGRS